MIKIDGSMGEGGGQILRTSLALSLVTGAPVRLSGIRVGRRKPGLRLQHLTCVRAATEIGDASVQGDTLGSKELTFRPRRVSAGSYSFAVGSAGSATLVFQTVLPALLLAEEPSRLVLKGGTHNPMAPPFEFLDASFLPLVSRMGSRVEAALTRSGFYPAGGGRFEAHVMPTASRTLEPLVLLDRGPLVARSARALVSRLPSSIGQRELDRVADRLGWSAEELSVEMTPKPRGPGNALICKLEFEQVTAVFSGFGDRGVSAEKVADRTVARLQRYLATSAPVCRHLTDQLLIPLALAGGGAFRTQALSSHATTNIEVIKRFLDVDITIRERESEDVEVRVTAPSLQPAASTITVGRVVEVAYDVYTVSTPSGRRVTCQRDQLTIGHRDQLRSIERRQLDWDTLKGRVIFSAVVGSTAWGLSDENSDEDVKGVFLLPFDETSGLWQPADEIGAPDSDAQYWEVQKLVYQGLRGDANTLETLWSPLVKVQTDLGSELLASRRMFVSRAIFGTFGRYAISQFRKMRSARRRHHVTEGIASLVHSEPGLSQAELEERLCEPAGIPGFDEPVIQGRGGTKKARQLVKDLYRSLHDRGLIEERGYAPFVAYLGEVALMGPGLEDEPPRWKNAYNLLRLLHSGTRWLREGEPLIEVTGELRGELLSVKRGEVPLDEVLTRADDLATEMERAYESTALPEEPDHEAAHTFLLRCREHAAREWIGRSTTTPTSSRQDTEPMTEAYTIAERRYEIPEPKLRDFLRRYDHLDTVVCGLVGSHSYGFPSPDSDFDLKAIHLAPAAEVLGLQRPKETVNFLDTVGGLEMDYTSHEAGSALARLLKGDGNALERIFSPYQILPVETDERLRELRALARDNLSRRFHRHYAGFLAGTVKRYDKERTHEVKPLLYMARVALTGVHLLVEGEILADLPVLLETYPLPWVSELLRIKNEAEHARIEDDTPYTNLAARLDEMLRDALERSVLPEEPPATDALNDWLVRHRMSRA